MSESYFSYFKNVVINDVEIKNIFSKLRVIKDFKDNDNLFIDYKISDGETPETIAHTIYDSKELFWIILISNDIHDYYYDWPLRVEELENLAIKHIDDLIADVDTTLETGETLEEVFVELYGDTGETSDDYQTVVDRLINDKYIIFTDENAPKRDIVYLSAEYLSAFMIEVDNLSK